MITPEGQVFAVAEERLTRRRFQGGFPKRALEWIEKESGRRLDEAPVLIFGNRTHFLPRLLGNRFPSFEHDFFGLPHKLMLMYHHLCYSFPAFSSAVEAFNRALLWLRHGKRSVIYDHHFAHAASAYYTSGYQDAVMISVDNYGDGYSAKIFDCDEWRIRFIRGSSALRSPGQFYGEIAQIAGIRPLLAGKLTGLAASGDSSDTAKLMEPLFGVTEDEKDFTSTFQWGRSEQRAPFCDLKGYEKADLAAGAQHRFEQSLVRYVHAAVKETGRKNVALAGGCFANVRLNQKILELPEVESVWIHPAMSDQGISMGAALAYIAMQNHPLPFSFENVLLGPSADEDQMPAVLEQFGLSYEKPEDMEAKAAELLAQGKVIARFDGPMEYGLRALGNRSVLYQTTDPDLQSRLNEKLQRAAYMPFAPITMEPFAADCFVDVEKAEQAARFMTISFYATDWMRKVSPGVVHVDGTVRPQILHQADNPKMYRILDLYRERTGVPSLVNTSFNLHSEPIVASAHDACLAFTSAKLDYLILGPFLACIKRNNGNENS